MRRRGNVGSTAKFQSSPAFTGGRFDVLNCPVFQRIDVSILARLYRRALPLWRAKRFARPWVSILARLYRRALLLIRSHTFYYIPVSILARLYRRALPEQTIMT